MIIRRILHINVTCVFIINCIFPYLSYSQDVTDIRPFSVPAVATSVFSADLKGIKINPQNPLEMDFIIKATDNTDSESLKTESLELVKYFLAMLTIPKGDLWVNLSPYEKSRIAPQGLDRTFLGQDMLLQDYLLKQISSALTNPQKELGKKFWQAAIRQSKESLGTSNIPINTYNKIWIVPDKADIYVKDNSIFIVSSHLRVLLDSDYLAITKTGKISPLDQSKMNAVMRKVILPVIERQVNTSDEFSRIREIYHAFILAVWFKKHLQAGAFSNLYINKKKIGGIDIADEKMKEKVYRQYLKIFKKGVYNFIKEDLDPATNTMVPRKYFSGGADFTEEGRMNPVAAIPPVAAQNLSAVHIRLDAAMASIQEVQRTLLAQIRLLQQRMEINEPVNDNFKNILEILSQDISIGTSPLAEQTIPYLKDAETLFNENRYAEAFKKLTQLKEGLSQRAGTDFERQVIDLLQNTINLFHLNLRFNRTDETFDSREQYWQSKLGEILAQQQPIERQVSELKTRQQEEKGRLLADIRQLEAQKDQVPPSARLVSLRASLQNAVPGSATAISLAVTIKRVEDHLYGPINGQLQEKTASLQQLDNLQAVQRRELEQNQQKINLESTRISEERQKEMGTIESRKNTLAALLKKQRESIQGLSAALVENQEIRKIPDEIKNFEQLGQWLRERRESLDITQSYLVDTLQSSFNTIVELEKGESFVRKGTMTLLKEELLKKLASTLRINPDIFIAKIKQIIKLTKEEAVAKLTVLEAIPADINTPLELGGLIQQRRKELLLSQSSLAEELELTVLSMTTIETGKYFPQNAIIKKLAEKLKIDPEALIEKFNEFKSGVDITPSNFDPQTVTLKDIEQTLNTTLEDKDTVTWAEFVGIMLSNKGIPETSTTQLVARLQELGVREKDWQMFILFFSILNDIDKDAVRGILLESSKQQVTEGSLQEFMMNKIIAHIGTQGSQIERELIRDQLHSLGYPNAEALIIDRRFLTYTAAVIRRYIIEATSIDSKDLESHLVARMARATSSTEAIVRVHLESVGINSNEDLLAVRKLNNVSDKNIYDILLSLFENETEYPKILTALIHDLSSQTQAKSEFIKSRLSDLGLDTPEGIQKAFGLLVYAHEDEEDLLESLQESDSSSMEAPDEELISKIISSIATVTGNTPQRVIQFFNVMWVDWRQEILNKRVIINGQLKIKNKLMDDEFMRLIERLKQGGQEGLLVRVIDTLAITNLVPTEAVQNELADLGFTNDASLYLIGGDTVQLQRKGMVFTNGHRYGELRRRLNQGLVNLGIGYGQNAINEDNQLKAIFHGNVFGTHINKNYTAQRIRQEASTPDGSVGKGSEGQHERDLKERDRKLALWVLYLLYTGDNDLKDLFLSVNPSPKYREVLRNNKSSGDETVVLSPEKRHYLELIWTIFGGRQELKKRGFPEIPLRTIDVYRYFDKIGTSGNRERISAGDRFLRTKGQNYGKMVISRDEYNVFLKEKGVTDDAMKSSYGGIDLNENLMSMTEKGDAFSLNIDPRIFKQYGFKGFAPLVIKITPIEDLSIFL